jgi:RNA polymerase sigma factor (sigma-70 family)
MKDLSDAELVLRYARGREENAFAEIARRHGPMVYATCRRLLGEGGAADDAAQAVFMLLARKAGSLSRREALAGWLHGAARLVAREHLRAARRRRRAEKEAAEMRAARQGEDSPDWESIRGEIDAEIGRLPRHYRDAVLLSCVEGRSEAETARELGVPAGTVKSRVSRGLEKLRERFAQRGRVMGVAALAALLAEHGRVVMPTALAAKVAALGAGAGLAAVAAAEAGATTAVLLMMEGALKAMMMAKLKLAAAVLGAAVVVGTAVPVTRSLVQAGEAKAPPAPAKKPADGVLWGKAVNDLQAGLVPLGGDSATKWGGPQCPKCRKFNRKLVMSKCSKCGVECGSNRPIKFCQACAAAKRVCQACGIAKPWSATFVSGQPMHLELHLRNVGKKPIQAAWAHCSWQWQVVFTAKGGSLPRIATYSGPIPKIAPGAMPPVLKLPAGKHWCTVLTRGKKNGKFRYCGKKKIHLPDLDALPPGKYTVTATYSYSDSRKRGYWSGRISTASVEVEVKAKGAAAPAGGDFKKLPTTAKLGGADVSVKKPYAWRDWMPIVRKPGPDGGSPLMFVANLALKNDGAARKVRCRAYLGGGDKRVEVKAALTGKAGPWNGALAPREDAQIRFRVGNGPYLKVGNEVCLVLELSDEKGNAVTLRSPLVKVKRTD